MSVVLTVEGHDFTTRHQVPVALLMETRVWSHRTRRGLRTLAAEVDFQDFCLRLIRGVLVPADVDRFDQAIPRLSQIDVAVFADKIIGCTDQRGRIR